MQSGDAVSFAMGDTTADAKEMPLDIHIIGVLANVIGETAYIVEVHAFHRLWGGSSATRGELHEVPRDMVDDCPREYLHIIREQSAKGAVADTLSKFRSRVSV